MDTAKNKPDLARNTADKKPADTTSRKTRRSKPLYAGVTLGTLRKLLGDKDNAYVTVSRNFILGIYKDQLEEKAEEELGIS